MTEWPILVLNLRENNGATLRLEQPFVLHHLYYLLSESLHCFLEGLIICSKADPWNIL